MVEDTGYTFEFGTMSFFNGKQSREYKKFTLNNLIRQLHRRAEGFAWVG